MSEAAHWTRAYMRTVALWWRDHRCEANLTTAIWWRDFTKTYGKTTQTLGASNASKDDSDARELLCKLRNDGQAGI
jgi:hypothetical protein